MVFRALLVLFRPKLEEVTWVARRVYMSREEGEKRFGDKFSTVPLTHEPIGLDEMEKQVVS